jgi:hypothetical protein
LAVPHPIDPDNSGGSAVVGAEKQFVKNPSLLRPGKVAFIKEVQILPGKLLTTTPVFRLAGIASNRRQWRSFGIGDGGKAGNAK